MEIIAEIGSNWWKSDLDSARKTTEMSIRIASKRGATAVKFQLWDADKLYSRERADKSYARAKQFQFPIDWLPLVRSESDKFNLRLWASVFDEEVAQKAIPFLDVIKIASGDLTNLTLVRKVANLAHEKGIPIALSTGASTEEEVKRTLDAIGLPCRIFLFQCVSAYPASPSSYSLVVRYNALFYSKVEAYGISDHTLNDDLAKVAVGAGYTLFEKHFCMYGTSLESPDFSVSLTPNRFQVWSEGIKSAFSMMGNKKVPQEEEMSERIWARRGRDGLRPRERSVDDSFLG